MLANSENFRYWFVPLENIAIFMHPRKEHFATKLERAASFFLI
jgi:hypothetical protein